MNHKTNPPDLVQWVDPDIGAISHLLAATVQTVQMPHGMIRLAPNRPSSHPDPFLADHVTGFPLNIVSHRGERAFSIMAASGEGEPVFVSEMDHDFESASPHEFALLLEDAMIDVSYTVTEHTMIYRFAFTKPGRHLRFAAKAGGTVEVLPHEQAVRGREQINKLDCYFYAKADAPFASWKNAETKQDVSARVSFEAATIEVRIGFSYISCDQAKQNMEMELAGKTFARVSSEGRAAWNNALGRINVEGGTEKQRRIFYTALWRCHERQVNITENGRYFSGYDHRVHEGEKTPFYVDDWLWDTHRGLHPLRLIIDPNRERDILESYARMIAQNKDGWAPVFPLVFGNRAAMLGNHMAAVAADAYMKGVRGFDIETLYAGLRKNAIEGSRIPWYVGPATELDRVYLEKGFFPALAAGQKEWVPQVHGFERRQSVSVTLEHAYDDWCIAELARSLGKHDDAAMFAKRALNYRTLYNAATGVMAPRTADGEWVEPFDPGLSGGPGGRDYYAECNGLTWSWSVPHDVAGMMRLFGGRDAFLKRLDHFFNQPLGTSKWDFLGQFPDSTGLIGQFPMGNEPGFLIPYLYLYAGAPWRTQRRVREIMRFWFDDTPLGVCGDDDGGAMSAWYVFNAIGFYPLCPGRPVYGIGSPIFEKTRIQLGNGVFTIEARNVSAQNKYVQSAELNGQPLNKPWFEHRDLKNGGSLILNMGPRPNTQWGNRDEDAPPSL